MRTFEMLIVFGALMAIIALVAIAIDWVGKPLRGRRFLPRLYRYDDEVLPPDQLAGHWTQPAPGRSVAASASMTAGPTATGTPYVTATPYVSAGPSVATSPPLTATPAVTATALTAAPAAALQARSSSAFTDKVLAPAGTSEASISEVDRPGDSAQNLGHAVQHHKPFGGSDSTPETPAGPWSPGMALDVRVDDRKPTLAIKAERFWQTAAAATSMSHFDHDDQLRMSAGKAPRRRNPRTGKLETMQLVGLRRASTHTGVRMRWPDDAVDPWSSR